MANETQIGKLVIDLQIKTQALEKGLNAAKQKIQEMEDNNKSLENSNKSLDASFIAMSASILVALNKIGSAIKSCVNEYNSYTQAMNGLQNIANYTGQDMQELTDIMNKFSQYGLAQSDIATAIKNFSLMGYTAEDTEKMITALTESAISNRQACYSVSEAVKMASEGYKNGISTLSDAAGVTENLSVMESKYAESIGKTAGQLTDAEKNQAYLNRTMEAAAPFAGATAQYMETLAGKQGEYSQALRETQVAYAEALEPTLMKIEEFKTTMLNTLTDFISSNEEATAGVTAFVVTLGTFALGIMAVKKAYDTYKTSALAATISTQGFTAALAANPLGAVLTVISLAVSAFAGLSAATETQRQKQEELNEVTERYNQIKEGTYKYTDENISTAQSDIDAINEQIALMNEQIDIQKQINEINERSIDTKGTSPTGYWYSDEDLDKLYELKDRLKDSNKSLEEARNRTANYGNSIEELNNKLNENIRYLDEANAVKKISEGLDTDSIKNKQKEAAQLKVNANQMQKYLDTVKTTSKSSTEYQAAVKALAEAYPEAANAEGIIISKAQDYINAEKLKADTAWNASQETIQSYINMINAALQSESVQKQVAQNIGISFEELKPKLESVLGVLKLMAGYQAEDVPGVEPVSISYSAPSISSSSNVYENKQLDNYKSLIEYKKSLDQISLKEEISMYQKALNSYAKTTDEKRELKTKIYELNKELDQKELDDYISLIEYKKSLDQLSLKEEISMYKKALNNYAKTTEDKRELRTKIYELNKEMAQKEKDLLDQQTEDYERYIEEQKNLRGAAYDAAEQAKDYDAIIKMHKNYLSQIMKDERLSLDERKELYREELQTIRDYEQQKRDLRVESIDDTVSQLTDAITKQLQELQEKDKELIDKNLEEVERWKNARIDAINEEYDARIEAIDKELEALNKAEEQKSRDEEDSEYERKRKRLEELIAFEHDATNKANYQKQLDELVADYQKTLEERALQDKKDILEEQKDQIQEEQDAQIEAIENEAEKRKESYEQQLDELEKYYDEQIDMAQQTAEKMLLNVEDNQKQILNLLKNYGDAYEITGQSLGEKLAQGINEGVTKNIQNIIQKIQDTIDTNIENKLKEWTKGSYTYRAGQSKPQVTNKTINVYQTNNIEQNPELPSETYRKLKAVDEQLAAQLAGI